MITEWDWRQDVTSIRSPTLVIHGEEDLIPEKASREWAVYIPQSHLLSIPGSGHFPHLGSSEFFLYAVDQFLNGEWPEGSEEVDDDSS